MIDKVTIDRINLLHPKLRDEALEIYNEAVLELGDFVTLRFTHTLRTIAEQNALYAQGRSKPGKIITNAKGGMSFHNYGLAIDIVLLVDRDKNGTHEAAVWDDKADFDKNGKRDWLEVVNIFKQHGWEWGGDWKFYDAPHFQKTFGKSVRELLDLYNRGKVDKNGYVLI